MRRAKFQLRLIGICGVGVLALLASLAVEVRATPIVVPEEEGESTWVPAQPSARGPAETHSTATLRDIEPSLGTEPRSAGGVAGTGPPIAPSSLDLQRETGGVSYRGETLEQVLRSLTNIAPTTSDRNVPSSELLGSLDRGVGASADNDNDWADLRDAVLSSTIAGGLVRLVVEAHSVGESTYGFSVFGLGNFALEAASGGGAVELSEISSGWSIVLPGHRSDEDNADVSGGSGSDVELSTSAMLPRLIMLVLGYLTSPLAIVLEALAALLVLFWLVVRGAALLRESEFSSARLVASPDRSGPVITHERSRRRRSRRHRRRRRGARST